MRDFRLAALLLAVVVCTAPDALATTEDTQALRSTFGVKAADTAEHAPPFIPD